MSRSRQRRSKEKRKEQRLQEEAEQARASQQKSTIQTGSVALAAIAVDARASMQRSTVRGGAAALAVVAVVLGATGIGHFAGSSGQRSPNEVEKQVSALLSGIPQNGAILGQASAPITLQIFGDLESEDVRTFVVWILPAIIHNWVRTNIVKIQYRSFMTESFAHPEVFVSRQAAALAAGIQGRLWNFIETFYQEQGKKNTPYVTEAYLDNIAGQIPGLDLSQWYGDRKYNRLIKQVIKDDNDARAVGFHETPSFLVGRTGGELVPWQGYRLYEERGPKDTIRRRPHPLSFITSRILKTVIEHLP